MANFYKRHEKEILSILLVAFTVGTILVWVDIGTSGLSFRESGPVTDVDSIEEVTDSVVESVAVSHDVRYELRENDNSIVAYVDGICMETGIRERKKGNNTNHIIKIQDVADLNDDGYAEAILQVVASAIVGNSSPGSHSEIVFFDPQINTFRRIDIYSEIVSFNPLTKTFRRIKFETRLKLDKWNDQLSLVTNYKRDRYGSSLFFERYILKSGELSMVEDVEKSIPLPSQIYTIEYLFPERKKGWNNIVCDIDDDGKRDVISLAYEGGYRLNDYWSVMALSYIILASGKKIPINLGIRNLGILQSRTKGMHDLVEFVNDDGNPYLSRLYRWDGSTYHLVRWNGNQWILNEEDEYANYNISEEDDYEVEPLTDSDSIEEVTDEYDETE